ncbi:methyl-accepting chemotaxis protein [Derxia lacustris]|uniref:methyl-accepting chemotaxis protein n=1 Tax=Derxia lacustris TaxID=764842 RepID=UPI000A16EAF6|nr:methyl-accepting chemotaxis protein [Derxia lacustris]
MLLNLRLTTRIAGGVAILICLIVVNGLVGALALRSQASAAHESLVGGVGALRLVAQLRAEAAELAWADPAAVDATRADTERLATAPIDAALLARRDAVVAQLRSQLDGKTGRGGSAEDDLGAFAGELVTAAEQRTQREVEAADTAFSVIVGSTIASVLFGALLGWLMRQAIRQPVEQLVESVQRIAAGDLVTRIGSKGRDEIAWLNYELNTMRKKLHATIDSVRSSSATVAHATQEIASGNADLSARTEGQASGLEQTAASMEELTATVRQNAENARQANQLVLRASDVATRGGTVMSEVVATMGDINASARRAVDIISVIDGIAFQTNILALNAAVEAARAGEQGRGFAVVASEVRSLAQRSAEASKEIKQLIGNSVEKADVGARLVGDAGSTMDEILTSVRQVTDIMAEISAASEEQRMGIEQVNSAIEQMDGATQQNAALVEQAAAAAESLREQAGRLHEAVQAFRTA